jgi:transglutaminase-like putative cysteine protease
MYRRAVRSIGLSILIATIALLHNLSFSARADEIKKQFAGYTKYVWYRTHYDVNPDGTDVETQAWALKVLTDQGVAQAQKASISFSDRLQTVEILSAYTLKSDGRRISVPAANFQDETNTGKDNAAPMFSDIGTKTVAFPDVAVGDTVVLSYKETQKEATFPGNFSMARWFSKFGVYDEVRVSISAPASLGLRAFSRGVVGGEAPSSDGRRNWAWFYKNEQVATPENDSVSPLDYGPVIIASTFKDYAALAAAYNARAKAKSEPTDSIRKLASDLTSNAHTPRAQAKALYDWVARNVKYADNSVGLGSVVPHSADVVLANRMGDCKDHVALMQALLAAKGIASTPVLINAGNAYSLPELPATDVFNHVMNYIPSLDLYADSTSEYTPFGSLPVTDQGKPVVQTVEFHGIRRTPVVRWDGDGQKATTVISVHADGSADGETEIDTKGELAESGRLGMTYLQPNMEDAVMRQMLAANGFTGTGTIVKGDLKEFTNSYKYGSKFKISDAINLPGPGAMYIRSPFEGDATFARWLIPIETPDPTVNFACTAGFGREELTINLPRSLKVKAVPRDVEIKGEYLTYKATYREKNGTITAVREIEDHSPAPVCTLAIAAEYKKFALGIKKDLHAQLLYE